MLTSGSSYRFGERQIETVGRFRPRALRAAGPGPRAQRETPSETGRHRPGPRVAARGLRPATSTSMGPAGVLAHASGRASRVPGHRHHHHSNSRHRQRRRSSWGSGLVAGRAGRQAQLALDLSRRRRRRGRGDGQLAHRGAVAELPRGQRGVVRTGHHVRRRRQGRALRRLRPGLQGVREPLRPLRPPARARAMDGRRGGRVHRPGRRPATGRRGTASRPRISPWTSGGRSAPR